MKAFRTLQFGEAKLESCPIPTPKPGQVRVKIKACSLNFADLLMIKGKYQDTPPPPFTLGLELSGVVEAAAEDVDPTLVGKSVAIFAGQGGLAEYGCFDANLCVPLPSNMSHEHAAAFQIAYGTSHVALDYKANLRAGETLLVLGASGGVGLTAVEIGKRMGATVIACARGSEKLKIAQQAGADHLIDSETEDLRNVVKSLGGADVVYDPIGGDLFRSALRACNPDARILVIGFSGGDVPQIPANHLLVKNVTAIGFYWGAYLKFKPHVLTDSMSRLFSWYEAGDLRPHISHTLPLERAEDALELLRSRASTGKVVVTP
ncbi:NADPH:quinone oxidoreductase family protein [Cochlodiniinecator piscidefendens]|uniref:NADPH:quinone oxidoreductase family protein n=1 Tax=Cochlodiniinecator piscidefendens TaxID=2715756 RepID=UPI00140802FF|nr:NADPH:quinone oxidoreductase family protein [Cochlodiniinecator piscidefendens]